MMDKFVIVCGLVLGCAGVLSAEEAAHTVDPEAVLTIQVENGTQGGTVDEATPVTVNFYHGDHLVKQESAQTDAQGACSITGIPSGTEIVAVAQAKHSDMAFSSEPVQLPAGKKQHNLTVQVFDVLNDNTLIHAGTHHLIAKRTGRNIHITEYIQLVNDSDKAILSAEQDAEGRPKVIQIALPKHFAELTFSSYFHPDAVVQTEEGFYDTMAIPPGSYHGVFSYDVPLGEEAIEFSKTITLTTEKMMVFVASNSGIHTDFGEPDGQMDLRDGTPTQYYTIDVSPGSVLTFQADGVPSPESQRQIWIVLGIVFSVVAAAAVLRVFKQKSSLSGKPA